MSINILNPLIIYSFRRCPYCIRAHMALKHAGLKVILRSITLKHMPKEALAVSPNATVPSLVITENEYIDESWDIVKWAVRKNDPSNWLGENDQYLKPAEDLIKINDGSFKSSLDRYKYASRHPEHSQEHYRKYCESFILMLNERLKQNQFLLAEHITVADIGIFPFIRQFAMVDKEWFDNSSFSALQDWLRFMLKTEWFKYAFTKYELWKPENKDIYL